MAKSFTIRPASVELSWEEKGSSELEISLDAEDGPHLVPGDVVNVVFSKTAPSTGVPEENINATKCKVVDLNLIECEIEIREKAKNIYQVVLKYTKDAQNVDVEGSRFTVVRT